MSELIERQAAIDAIHCNIVVTGRENAELVAKTMGEFVDRIKALPTIQPEVLACGNGELIAKPEPQWIPVSERLPETGVEVLTYDEALNYIEIQTVSDGRWENQRGDWQDLDDIAAWMPLPEAYKPNK